MRSARDVILLIIVIFLSSVFRLIPFLESDFKPYSWDGLSIVYGAQRLLENGTFTPDILQQSGYSPIEYVRRKPYYPFSQLLLVHFHIFISNFFGVKLYNSIVFLSLILNIVILLLIYFNIALMTENKKLATLGALIAAIFPTSTRDIIWCTLFSLLGYIIILLSLLSLMIYVKFRKIIGLVLSLIFVFALSPIIHLLTSIVLFPAYILTLAFMLNNYFNLKHIKKIRKLFFTFAFIIIILVIGSLSFINMIVSYPETSNLNIFEKVIFVLYLGSSYYMHARFTTPLHQPWNIPLIYGYVQFIFGIIGLMRIRIREVRVFLVSLFLTSFSLGNAYLIGFNYYGERPILFGWISISLALPYGISLFIEYLKDIFNNRWVRFSLVTIAISAVFINSYVYQKDFYESWKPSLPSKYDLEAIRWLNEKADKKYTILTINYWPYVSTKWIPILTNMNTTFLNIESVANYNEYQPPTYTPKGFIGFIANKLKNEKIELAFKKFVNHTFEIGYDQLGYETFLMFKYPGSNESRKLFDEYKVKYIYLYNDTPEDKIMRSSTNFKLVWSNKVINIYERKDRY
jgi:hypothetical protein